MRCDFVILVTLIAGSRGKKASPLSPTNWPQTHRPVRPSTINCLLPAPYFSSTGRAAEPMPEEFD